MATTKTREIADQAALAGIMPLEFLLRVMRDEEATRAERIDCAKSAAPYVHPRLSSTEVKAEVDMTATITEVQLTGPE